MCICICICRNIGEGRMVALIREGAVGYTTISPLYCIAPTCIALHCIALYCIAATQRGRLSGTHWASSQFVFSYQGRRAPCICIWICICVCICMCFCICICKIDSLLASCQFVFSYQGRIAPCICIWFCICVFYLYVYLYMYL